MLTPQFQAPVLPLTDDRARSLVPANETEPQPGSVVLINGPFGMAWQRHFDDGLWHSTRPKDGRPREWAYLMSKRNLVLVYDAAVRS